MPSKSTGALADRRSARQLRLNRTSPQGDPPMAFGAVKLADDLALNTELAPPKRAFAARILPTSYASLRFPDVHRLRTFGANDDSARGALTMCKTRRPHGQGWPWACARLGATGPNDRVKPLVDFRQGRAKTNGYEQSFAFPRVDRSRQLERSAEAPYASDRRKLALLCADLCGK